MFLLHALAHMYTCTHIHVHTQNRNTRAVGWLSGYSVCHKSIKTDFSAPSRLVKMDTEGGPVAERGKCLQAGKTAVSKDQKDHLGSVAKSNGCSSRGREFNSSNHMVADNDLQ